MWSLSSLIVNGALLALPFLIVSIASVEFQWRRKERKVFVEREEERRIYISKVLDAQENERKRIARDLHDDTIQTLLALANNANALSGPENIDVNDIKEKIGIIRDATVELADNLRKISLELRPSVLDNLGLVPALRWLIDRFSQENSISTKIQVNGIERKLSPQTEVIIFRIVQEALNNIRRHSRANEAVVTIEFAADNLKIKIQDNGQGFNPPKEISSFAAKGKLGLAGIQERISCLGGTLQIHSTTGIGTLLVIEAKC